MAEVPDEPVAGPLYDALAAAFAPHVVAGRVTLTYPRIVAVAASTFDDREREWEMRCANLRRQLGACHSESIARQKAHDRLVTELRRERLETVMARAAELDAARSTATRMAERAGRLEAVVVQARARWDHEGGPTVLREAFANLDAVSP